MSLSSIDLFTPVIDTLEIMREVFRQYITASGGTALNPPCNTALLKRDFALFRNEKTWVTECSVGEMCYVLMSDDGMYVCDLSENIYYVHALTIPAIGRRDSNQQGTLFVADLTWNFHYQKYCFMITDVLYLEDENVGGFPVSMRLDKIRDHVVSNFRNKYYAANFDPKDIPLILMGKDFYPLKELKRIISNVHEFQEETEPSGYRYLYKNAKRYNDTKGFLFIQESNSIFSEKIRLWRWPVMNTAKFNLKITDDPSPKFILYLRGDDQLIKYREVYFTKSCQNRLKKDLGGKKDATIECFYNTDTIGEWVYYTFRNGESENNFEQVSNLLESKIHKISKNLLIKEFLVHTKESPVTSPSDIIYESPIPSGNEPSPIPFPYYGKRKLELSDEQREQRTKEKFKKPRLSKV